MIRIRPATPADIDTIHQLGQNVDEFHTSDVSDAFWPKQILADSVESDAVMLQVAQDDGEIIGFIIVNCNKSLRKAEIENIFVAPSRRQEGVASIMLQATLQNIRDANYRYISTLVPTDDTAAIQTYQKAGFAQGETFLWLDVPVATPR